MERSKIIPIFIMLALSYSLISTYGCNNKQYNNEQIIDNDIQLSLSDKDLENTLYKIIRDTKDTDSEYTVDNFILSPEDNLNALEIKETYICNNAIYVKVDSNGKKYLYRFQLNKNGLIKDYIKYELEA